MLYFSETGWTLPGMAEAAKKFESEYDSRQYDRKIATLIKNLQKRLKPEDPNALKEWSDALGKLSEGDHYLLVLARLNVESPHRPPHDCLKLCVTVLLIVVVGVGLMGLLPEQATGAFAREKSAFIIWLIAIIGLSGFLLLALLLGRQRANDILGTLISKIFGDPGGK